MKARRGRLNDWPVVGALAQGARRTVPRLWRWEDHLADDVFVVVERGEFLVGVLFAWPDDSPVAWVQLAALADTVDVGEWLDLALPRVLDGLRRSGTRELAWMDYRGWAGLHLGARGFDVLTEVVTLAKLDRSLPDVGVAGARLRPAAEADIPAIVAIDRAAFTPHWWHSEATMRWRTAASSYFGAAESAGRVVGYAEGELHSSEAHLNRVAVHPDHQGRGIGTSLLCDALRALWRCGAERVMLNTQSNNYGSQRLYRRLGFEMMRDVAQERVTVWNLRL
jgi:[ribosomal protein S18]-alanine N-acetyltransferase